MNLEWTAPMWLNTPYTPGAGSGEWAPYGLPINQLIPQANGSAWLYLVMPPDNGAYSIVPGKGTSGGGFRPVVDSLSQADGMSVQPPFIDGMMATIELSYQWSRTGSRSDIEPAGAPDAVGLSVQRQMDELIMGALNSLRTYPPDVSTQQYLWLPAGLVTNRLLDGVMLGSWPTPDFTKGPPEVRLKFDLVCPYPYAILDAPHTTAPIAPGASSPVSNLGNTATTPILFIPGPMTYCKVTVFPSGLTLIYDDTLPGAVSIPSGHTLQIDFHEGSCLLDGNPTLDYIAGLDPSATVFWPIEPDILNGSPSTVAVDPLSDGSVTVVSYDGFC